MYGAAEMQKGVRLGNAGHEPRCLDGFRSVAQHKYVVSRHVAVADFGDVALVPWKISKKTRACLV